VPDRLRSTARIQRARRQTASGQQRRGALAGKGANPTKGGAIIEVSTKLTGRQLLKASAISFITAGAALLCLLALDGCAPEYHVSYCRHRALECALVYGEIYGPQNVGVAIGPTSQHGWHAQSCWKSPEGVRWLDNLGHGCQVGQREPFAPMQYFDVSGFMKNQFPEFK